MAESQPESKAEVIRSLITPLADGSSLLVGDERRRSDTILTGVLAAFAWAVAATLAMGTIGGLWLSAQFLGRINSMRQTARRLMDGDWSRRIPLSRTDDDLTALARTFNRLFDRIEKLLQANKQVSADIAHDLRKPLAGVLRRLEVVRDEPSSGAARGAIDAVIGDVEGVLETFNALLRIGQVEAGARRAAFRPLDLAELAREVVETFAPAAEDESKTLVQRLDAPLPISGDKELLVQMIANLIDNALRHTPAGVRIEVGGERTADGDCVFRLRQRSGRNRQRNDRDLPALPSRGRPGARAGKRPRSRVGRRNCRPARPRLPRLGQSSRTARDDCDRGQRGVNGSGHVARLRRRLTPTIIARTRFSRWRRLARTTPTR